MYSLICLFSPLGHEEKCNVLLFHPLASSLLTSAGYDGSVFIWDLENREVAITLDPLPEPVSSSATQAGISYKFCMCVYAIMFTTCVLYGV